jgi:hypothetical protein
MNILDFLPIYQNIDSPDFYNSVYRKKELYDSKLPKTESLDIRRGEQFNHQKIISRFLSGYTLYDEILLFHSMGTGKSCTSVGVIEECRKSGYFKRAIIVAPNKALLHNYIEELVYKCTDGKYEPKEKLKKNHTERIRVLKNNIKNFFSFKTYGELYNDIIRLKIINKSSDMETYKNVISMYSNTIIVLDEVHNLRPKKQKKEGIDLRLVYNEIHKLCMLTRNRKIIAMTGTPMRDRPEEISSILNLILPIDSQFEGEEEFKNTFLKEKKDGTYLVRKSKIEDLKERLKGRISFLQSMHSDVLKSFEGRTIPEFTNNFIINDSKMSKFQTEYYMKAIEQDGGIKGESITLDEDSSSGIYNNSRQASLFVYPDGSYGSEGFSNYITKVEKKVSNISSNKQNIVKQFSLTKEMKNYIFLNIQEEEEYTDKYNNIILENIGKYSSIYKYVIKDVLENPDKCTYIYSELVTGSGAILLSKLFELVGFKKANGNETEPGRRYAILTSETSTNSDILKIKKMMNDSNNVYGDYIQVIIGSDTTTEGFSLYNIQREHILTPFWNYTKIDQAIARGIRMGSHRFIKQEGLSPEVKIFQHASIPETKDSNDSIHLRMYKISEIKDISIKRIQRVLKESSIDCAFNIVRNKGNIYNSRECEYQKCEYTCKGVNKDDLDLRKEDLDISTYNIYYSDDNIKYIIEKLKIIFINKFIISLEELKEVFSDYSIYQLLNSMHHIISQNLIIKNRYGIDCFLKEDSGNYFISTIINSNDKIITLNYTRKPVLYKERKEFSYYIDILKTIYYDKYLDAITIPSISDSDFKHILSILDTYIKQDILEKCIISKYNGIKVNNIFRERVIEYFNDLKILEYTGEYIISSLTVNKRQFNIKNKIWEDYSLNISDFSRIQKILEPTTYKKYYGILEKAKIGEKEPEFKISFVNPIGTKVDKRTLSRGTVCSTRTASFIDPILDYLNTEYDSEINIKKLKSTKEKCNVIKNRFKELGLLLEISELENYKKQDIESSIY